MGRASFDLVRSWSGAGSPAGADLLALVLECLALAGLLVAELGWEGALVGSLWLVLATSAQEGFCFARDGEGLLVDCVTYTAFVSIMNSNFPLFSIRGGVSWYRMVRVLLGMPPR